MSKPMDGVLRGYANARKRARYWSGIPSFNRLARSNATTTSKLDEKYELAMCDCDSWEREIERISGKRPPHYDPKAAFAKTFTRLLNQTTIESEQHRYAKIEKAINVAKRCDALEAEVQELKRDKERLDWLEINCRTNSNKICVWNDSTFLHALPSVRNAIDAAIAQEGGSK